MGEFRFKIGDVLIAKDTATRYTFTRPGWIGKIVRVYEGSTNDIELLGIEGQVDRGPYRASSRDFEYYCPVKKKPGATVSEPYTREKRFMEKTMYMNGVYITRVIFNKPATIVFWSDGTKTVVKLQNNEKGKPVEKYDKEKGLAMCIAKKALGNKSNFNNTFKAIVTGDEDE